MSTAQTWALFALVVLAVVALAVVVWWQYLIGAGVIFAAYKVCTR